MKKIDDLSAVISPPPPPRVVASQADWLELFQQFGTRLPQDFVQFHKVYGEGWFGSVSHPTSANLSVYGPGGGHLSFARHVSERLSQLRVLKEQQSAKLTLPLYWEPGGLLPWGATTNGTDLCWRVRGELVDNWTVVAVRTASRKIEEYELSMSEFLMGIISGSLQSGLMPTGFPGNKGVVFEVWPNGPAICESTSGNDSPGLLGRLFGRK